MIITIPFTRSSQTVIKDDKEILIPELPGLTLLNTGAIIQITVTHPDAVGRKLIEEGKEVPLITVNALIDTGAAICAITPEVASYLNLLHIGYKNITSVQDEQLRPSYFAQFLFHWGSCKEVPVVSCPIKGADCIIGRDILMNWNITYNGKDGYIIICE